MLIRGMIVLLMVVAFIPLSKGETLQPLEVDELEVVTLSFAKEFKVTSQATHRNYRIQIAVIGPEPKGGYPVLAVLDGDAYFLPVATMANNMVSNQARVDNLSLVVVGVGYSDQQPIDIQQRSLDYTPPPSDLSSHEPANYGQADRFYQFLQKELLPYLIEHYSVNLKHFALFGHSFGGLYGLYDLFQGDSLFSYYILSSPSIWWGDEQILTLVPGSKQLLDNSLKITVGELEGVIARTDTRRNSRNMMGNAERLYQQLKAEGVDVEFKVYPDESHGSVAYKSVLDSLKFLQKQLP